MLHGRHLQKGSILSTVIRKTHGNPLKPSTEHLLALRWHDKVLRLSVRMNLQHRPIWGDVLGNDGCGSEEGPCGEGGLLGVAQCGLICHCTAKWCVLVKCWRGVEEVMVLCVELMGLCSGWRVVLVGVESFGWWRWDGCCLLMFR